MCEGCLREVAPKRGRTCLDGGSYVMNYKGCKDCGETKFPKIENKKEFEDEDGIEIVMFEHHCEGCGHLIAKHHYSFEVDDGYQEYSMTCKLCGQGKDSQSIDPVDPRKGSFSDGQGGLTLA